jgi:NAD(P)-dependent dehydrogenase (short-subunit alcohol dehydrogenase family)
LSLGTNSLLGIGRASAHQFAENGAKAIYLCDFDAKYLETHRAELNTAFPVVDIHVWRFDAADETAVKEVVAHAMSNYGRLDVFFANAGVVGPMKMFGDVNEEEFMKIMKTNVLR